MTPRIKSQGGALRRLVSGPGAPSTAPISRTTNRTANREFESAAIGPARLPISRRLPINQIDARPDRATPGMRQNRGSSSLRRSMALHDARSAA
jgi:hypothetical protein